MSKLKFQGTMGKARVYTFRDYNVIETFDEFKDLKHVRMEFGTDKMPFGRYQHISMSAIDHLPEWEHLKFVKDNLMGKDAFAFQILPPEANYVNVHNYCLHLWKPL